MDHEDRLRAAPADRYQIEREIGSGGLASVYLAQDLKHDRDVLPFTVPPSRFPSPSRKDIFQA